METIPSDAFTGLVALTTLEFSRDSDLSHIYTVPEPGFLDPLQNLRVLRMPGAKLQGMPRGYLCTLQTLEEVELERNEESVMEGFRCDNVTTATTIWPNLQYLNLFGNGITDIDLQFGTVAPNLQILGLGSNEITRLPRDTFRGLYSLVYLYLENNPSLGTLLPPDVFRTLYSLGFLNLENVNLTRMLPDMFVDNPNLQILLLPRNLLSDDSFQGPNSVLVNTPYLLYLDLTHNRVSNLTGLLEAGMDHLLILELGWNSLKDIPDGTFLRVPDLAYLDLNHNPLENVTLGNDTVTGLTQLQVLDLSYCYIPGESFAPGLFSHSPNLEQLNVAMNLIVAEIPVAFRDLRQVQILDLGWNALQRIQREDFAGMTALTTLDLRFSHFHNVPTDFLSGNLNVQIIYMQHGRIETIEYGAFQGLDNLIVLNLTGNGLKDIRFRFNRLPKLHTLDLEDNELTELDSDSLPPASQFLFLSFNRISSLDAGIFVGLSQLKLVRLEHNRLSKVLPDDLAVHPSLRFDRPLFFLAGNPIVCDCQMGWIMGVSKGGTGGEKERGGDRVSDRETE